MIARGKSIGRGLSFQKNFSKTIKVTASVISAARGADAGPKKEKRLKLGEVDFLTISLNYFITRLLKQLDKTYFHQTSGNVVRFLVGLFSPYG